MKNHCLPFSQIINFILYSFIDCMASRGERVTFFMLCSFLILNMIKDYSNIIYALSTK